MYSGISGMHFRADIFVGVVYYQRLRHMVLDKSQLRSSGAVHHITRQPVKGRKRHGGVRLGEMERDCLIAHGATFLIHDRLVECTDCHWVPLCLNMACPLARHPSLRQPPLVSRMQSQTQQYESCCECSKHSSTRIILPYIYR